MPAIVDVESFALHNGFEVNHPDAMTGVVGLLNIGHDVTNINILEKACRSSRATSPSARAACART